MTDARQAEVAAWFDHTYATQGFRYLRPLAAYPIYLQLLGARPDERLLDVACGAGLLVRAASERGVRATGSDLSVRGAELARGFAPRSDTVVANSERLPFADATFDLVTCIGALERFLDRGAALAEMRRVARSDARFCFLVRNSATLAWQVWSTLLGRRNVRGHQDALPLAAWRELFRSQGFIVTDVLPDQWARQKLRAWWRGFRPAVPTGPERVARPWLPLRLANEFLFLLRKA